MTDDFRSPVLRRLRAHALTYPETSEGSSCVNRAFKVRKKNFVFLGEKDDGTCRVMLKLAASLTAAQALHADGLSVGKTGWVTWTFPDDAPPDPARIEAWIDESFRALAPKTVVRQLEP